MVGICRDDDLSDLDAVIVLGPQTGNKVWQHQLVRPDAAHRRERAVQDVIEPAIRTRLLDGDKIVRLLDDADLRAVAFWI